MNKMGWHSKDITSCPMVLLFSLKNRLPWVLLEDVVENFSPAVTVLRQLGVPQPSIESLLVSMSISLDYG